MLINGWGEKNKKTQSKSTIGWFAYDEPRLDKNSTGRPIRGKRDRVMTLQSRKQNHNTTTWVSESRLRRDERKTDGDNLPWVPAQLAPLRGPCHHATVACQIRDLIVTLLDPRNGASQAGTLSSSSRLEKKIIQRWKWRHSPWIFQLLLFIIMFPLVMKTTCMKRTIMSLLGHLHTSMQLEKTTPSPKGFV